MEEPERPLGLGILAVLSFGAALWNIQSAVMLVLLVIGKLNMPEQQAMVAAYQALPEWFRWFLLVVAIAKAILLIGAGIAYFARRRIGRSAGTTYAILSIGESIVATAVFGNFGRDTIIGVLFAVYTLAAVNGIYRTHLKR